MKKANSLNELELLLLDSISINEDAIEALELLSEELNTSFALDYSKHNTISH